MVVTIVPDRISVTLNAGAALLVVCPSAERLFCHHCGSLEVSMAAKAPTTRNTARSSESDIGVSRTAPWKATYAVSAKATPTRIAPGNA